jgi:hypothetical protein
VLTRSTQHSRRSLSLLLVGAMVAFFSFAALPGAHAGPNDKGADHANAQATSQQQDQAEHDDQARPQEKTADTNLNDHPSGKDRTVEAGGSGTQGKSTSDPDLMTNGGADKPGMDGGFDEDKDGNNGCGNDDDFEDDNNGWCRGKPRVAAVVTPTVNPPVVLGETFERPAAVEASTLTAPAVVAAATAAAPAALARTGANAATLALFALTLMAVGFAMVAATADRRRLAAAPARIPALSSR